MYRTLFRAVAYLLFFPLPVFFIMSPARFCHFLYWTQRFWHIAGLTAWHNCHRFILLAEPAQHSFLCCSVNSTVAITCLDKSNSHRCQHVICSRNGCKKDPTLNLPMLLAHLATIFRMVPTAPSLSGTVALTLTLTLFCQIVNGTAAGTSWPMLLTFFALLWCCQFNCLSCQCDRQSWQHFVFSCSIANATGRVASTT
jgi:hypothetical protein